MDNILEVKNLKISFRTNNGTVKAVRDISFDLERGKTLAIVGESGSGKSVTSKAILGIQAGNAITEGGEILYDGKDLLKISEEDMCHIRGDKISMIFQDPLSSLNPIVRIGRQITEAMLLKNKTGRKNAKKDFSDKLALLKTAMTEASKAEGKNDEEKISQLCRTFDNFNIEGNRLANDFNSSEADAQEVVAGIEDFIFLADKNQKIEARTTLREFCTKLNRIKNEFFTAGRADEIKALASKISSEIGSFKSGKTEITLSSDVRSTLEQTKSLLETLIAEVNPDFFCIGYYKLKHPEEKDIAHRNISELNEEAKKFLDEDFMNEFLAYEEKGLTWSFSTSLDKKKALLDELKKAEEFYRSGSYDKAEAKKYGKNLSDAVEASIDRLEIIKDSTAWTFRSTLLNAIESYYYYTKNNPKEEKRFARQTRKHDRLEARGKNVDWKVIPKVVYDLDELKGNIFSAIENLRNHYENTIAASSDADMKVRSLEMVEHFKETAAEAVYVVTKSMAKEKAIKLMEEVGIPEPRIRFTQYPFEFSGGMRQRIVIAIALAANPDILICDEPTTALDVTIQSQILELINKLKEERHLSVIFITHDLGVVANMADEIAVMYAGKIVEYGTADEVFYEPAHPYTWALLSSMPDLDTKEKLDAIPGTPPNMIYPPEGDAFADRNKYALKIDFEQQPPKFKITDTHWAATWLLHPNAPKVPMPANITERIERMLKKSEAMEGAENNE